MEKTKKGDFIDLSFTGYSGENIFDSNIEEDLKKVAPEAQPKKLVIVIGRKMIIDGLDEALEDKEVGKEYEIEIKANKGFGPRRKELVRTMPLRIFTEQKINPQPGMTLHLDDQTARVLAVSGARVTADFNNPLAGKDIKYKFTINAIIKDEKEKATSVFNYFIGFAPEFEVGEKVTIKGPKEFERLVEVFGKKFEEIMEKKLAFELKEKKEENKTEEKAEEKKSEVKEEKLENKLEDKNEEDKTKEKAEEKSELKEESE